MSTTTTHLTVPPTPWKSAFHEHLSKMPSPEFVFSSLHQAPSNSPTPYIPHARYCIYRGMWTELPENKHNTAPQNPRVYESDMPTFTTDVRMQKVGELFSSSAGHAEKEEQTQGCGGGGPCEAVFWINETGTQWRIKGSGWIVGPDVEGEPTSGVRTLKSEVGRRMKIVDAEKHEAGEWSWGKELTAHFGNCSPGMRGWFSFVAVLDNHWLSADFDCRIMEKPSARYADTWERAGSRTSISPESRRPR